MIAQNELNVDDRVFVVGEMSWGTVTQVGFSEYVAYVVVDVDGAELAVPFNMMFRTEAEGKEAQMAVAWGLGRELTEEEEAAVRWWEENKRFLYVYARQRRRVLVREEWTLDC